MDTIKMNQPAEQLHVTIKGFEGDRWYSSAIEMTFEMHKDHNTTIDQKKVKRAIDIVQECEHGFEVAVKGYGEKVENHDHRYTSLYTARVDVEQYKGMQLYTIRINNEYNYDSNKAYPSANEAIKAVMQDVKRILDAPQNDFEYRPSNNE